MHLNQPIVGMAPTRDRPRLLAGRRRRWHLRLRRRALLRLDRGATLPRRRSSVWRRTRTGRGYWLVAADGGVFQLRRRALPRLGRRHRAQPADRDRRREPSFLSATRVLPGSALEQLPRVAAVDVADERRPDVVPEQLLQALGELRARARAARRARGSRPAGATTRRSAGRRRGAVGRCGSRRRRARGCRCRAATNRPASRR